jgi:DNA polymerase I
MRSFPGLFKWRDKTVRESRNNGYVVTRAGRRMVVTNLTASNSIVNFPVQGTGSDGFKFALWKLDGELRDLDARVVHILHLCLLWKSLSEKSQPFEYFCRRFILLQILSKT